MKKRLAWRTACGLALGLGLAGCAGGPEPAHPTPLGSLLSGTIAPEEYLQEVEQANRAAQEQERLDFNRETERAYNTRTGRYEYVPRDTTQRWNPETGRWEFTGAD